MKSQDLLFLLIFILLLFYRRSRYTWIAGFFALILSSLLLFLFDNRFTMQRLTWYAAAFFLVYTLHTLAIVISQKTKS